MKNYTISDLEKYSLIKAHTIRIWERRFSLFTPDRTATNYRLYSLDDLSHLLNISLLNRFGYKISQLSTLNKDKIKELLSNLSDPQALYEKQVNYLILCLLTMEIEDFEMALDSAVNTWGIQATLESVILPFLERVELYSYKGFGNSEYHFAITALRKKLILAIEKTDAPQQNKGTALLFLPKGEHYDLFLLYMNYRLKGHGFSVLYLGTDISTINLRKVIEKKNPGRVLTFVPSLPALKENKSIAEWQDPLFNTIQFFSAAPAAVSGRHQIHHFRSLLEVV
ncbi:MAG TPA: MerR family transcriptional regulator [Flavisolibacter sp.]|jgi:DNA-binding transcriptional MerR regulator|nr:MerR family transcriptional regulator [Flavisolibacter sp.]